MAKKRLNTSLTITVVVVFFVLCGLGVGAVAYAMHFDLEETLAEARQLEAEGDPLGAANLYGRAANKVGTDPALYLQFSDTVSKVGAEDRMRFFQAMTGLNEGLARDPLNEPILRRYLALDLERLDGGQYDEETRVGARDRAEAMLQVDPDHRAAQFQIARLDLVESEMNVAGAPDRDEAAAAIVALADEALGEGRALLWATRVAVAETDRKIRNRDQAGADETAAAALARLENAAEQVGQMEGEQAAAVRHHLMQATFEALPLSRTPETREAMIEQLFAAVDASVATQDPDRDADFYGDRMRAAAEIYRRSGRLDEAETVLRQALEAQPYSVGTARALAKVIASRNNRAAEAVALLNEPRPQPPELMYLRALDRPTNEDAVPGDLAKYHMQLANVDRENREQHITDAAEALDQYLANVNRNTGGQAETLPDVQRLQGELLLLQGRTAQALTKLEDARRLFESRGGLRNETRLETLLLIKTANLQLGQTAPARQALQELLRVQPGNAQLRLELAAILLRENRQDEALREVETGLRLAPEDERLLALQSRLTASDANYAELPESTLQEQLNKLNIARSLQRADEVRRLSGLIHEQQPQNVQIAILHAQALLSEEQQDQAVAVLERTIAAADEEQAQRAELYLAQVRGENLIELLPPFQKAVVDYRRSRVLDDDRTIGIGHLRQAIEVAESDTQRRQAEGMLFAELIATEQFAEVDQMIEAAEARDPIDGALYRISSLVARQQLEDAGRRAEQLRNEFPTDKRSALSLAKVREAQGDTSEAIENYEQVLVSDPTNTDALDSLIRLHMANGMRDEARFAIREARSRQPNDERFVERELAWELRFGDPRRALPSRQQAAEENPDRPAPLLALAQVQRAVARDLGDDVADPEARQALEATRDSLTQFVEKFPDNQAIGGVVQILADTQRLLGDVAGGEQTIVEAAELPPLQDTVAPALMLANYRATTGNREGAVEALANQLNAGVPDGESEVALRRRLSTLYQAMGDADAAVGALDGSDPALMQAQVELLINLGRTEEARQLAADALADEPDNPTMLALAAFAEIRADNAAAAKPFIDRAQAMDANSPQLLYIRGMYRLVGPDADPAAAAADLRQVVRQNPGNTDARRLLARAELATNNVDAGIRELEAALQARPDDLTSRVQLATLYQVGLEQPRFTRAEAVLAEHPESDADAAPVLLRERALLAARQNRDGEALQLFEQSARASGFDPQYAQQWLRQLLAAGQNDRVLTEVERLLGEQSVDAPTWWLHQLRAAAEFNTGNRQAASRSYAEALTDVVRRGNPAATQAIVNEAQSTLGADAALVLYDSQVAPATGDNPIWQLFRTRLLLTAGRFEEAAQLAMAAESAVEDGSALHRQALRSASNALLEQDPPAFNEAIPRLQTLLAGQADLPTLNNLAYALTLRQNDGDIAQAVDYSTQAMEQLRQLEQQNPRAFQANGGSVLDTAGRAQLLAGNIQEAMSLLNEAYNLSPTPSVLYHLAESHRQSGNAEQAQQLAAEGLRLLGEQRASGDTVSAQVEQDLTALAEGREGAG